MSATYHHLLVMEIEVRLKEDLIPFLLLHPLKRKNQKIYLKKITPSETSTEEATPEEEGKPSDEGTPSDDDSKKPVDKRAIEFFQKHKNIILVILVILVLGTMGGTTAYILSGGSKKKNRKKIKKTKR